MGKLKNDYEWLPCFPDLNDWTDEISGLQTCVVKHAGQNYTLYVNYGAELVDGKYKVTAMAYKMLDSDGKVVTDFDSHPAFDSLPVECYEYNVEITVKKHLENERAEGCDEF